MKRYYAASWTTTLVSSLSLFSLAFLPVSVYGEIRLFLAIYVTLGTLFTLGIPFVLVKDRKNLTKEAFQDILKVILIFQLLLLGLGLVLLLFWGSATSFSTLTFLDDFTILVCSFLYSILNSCNIISKIFTKKSVRHKLWYNFAIWGTC